MRHRTAIEGGEVGMDVAGCPLSSGGASQRPTRDEGIEDIAGTMAGNAERLKARNDPNTFALG